MKRLGLRLPREKKRDKAFILLYNQGHGDFKEYQRDTVHPWKCHPGNRVAVPEQGQNPHTAGQRDV